MCYIDNLEDNTWLSQSYEMHSIWVLTYINHLFNADMSSSEKVESYTFIFEEVLFK